MAETPEETAAWDAATVAMLRGLERNGHDRTVLADMSPADLKKVFDAEARHSRRGRGR